MAQSSTGTSSAKVATRGPVYSYEDVMSLQNTCLGLPPAIRERIEYVKGFASKGTSGTARSWRTGGKPPAAKPTSRPTILKPTADVSVVDKLVEKVRGKINRFDIKTYDETLTWLYENFDPENKLITGKILQLIFEKAVREEMFCGLFAKLLRELSNKFVVMHELLEQRFREFPTILEEAHESVDVKDAAKETDEFIRLNSEKKYRRGYALFIGELFSQSMFSSSELVSTLSFLVDNLWKVSTNSSSNIAEEYVHCIQRIFQGSKYKLADAKGCDMQVERIKELQLKRADFAGFTDKAYYATLDFITTYDSYIMDKESREIVSVSTNQIVAGYKDASMKTTLDAMVNDIMDCVSDCKAEFKLSISEDLDKLRVIVSLSSSETPGLSLRARTTLASIFRV